jgi:hypothetical protein
MNILNNSLKHHLSKFERVEADDGYIGGAPLHIKCPKSFTNDKETELSQQMICNRQEKINKRLKQWDILKQVYRHNLGVHGNGVQAILVLTQVAINHGENLFSAGYRDQPYNE